MRTPFLLASVIALTGIGPSDRQVRDTRDAVAVEIRTFQFAPDTLRVRAGERVVWTNRDEIEHTVTAGAPDARGKAFDRTLGGKGTTYEVTFEHPGTFGYFCDRHQFMRGTVIVTR